MTSHSTESNPATSRGNSAMAMPRVSASFRHGIWIISFTIRPLQPGQATTVVLNMPIVGPVDKQRAISREGCVRRVIFISRKWPPAIGGMETYALKLCQALAVRCDLHKRVLPGKRNGRPPGLVRLAGFLVGSWCFLIRARADVLHVGDLVLWPLALAGRIFRAAPCIVITA